VESKRSVPRSEINREAAAAAAKSAPASVPAHPAPSKTAASGSGASSSNAGATMSRPAPARTAAPSTSAPPAQAASNAPHAEKHDSREGKDSNSKHASSSDAKINLDDYAYNKIFVGGLHYDTRDGNSRKRFPKLRICHFLSSFSLMCFTKTAEFRSYFEKYGKVISAEVMFNRETHKSRGFGFIVFETENSAIKVCQVKEHAIDGKVVSFSASLGGLFISQTCPYERVYLCLFPRWR
jgi:RNA recognition motif-containing protein